MMILDVVAAPASTPLAIPLANQAPQRIWEAGGFPSLKDDGPIVGSLQLNEDHDR